MNSSDALNVDIYPDIISSYDFLAELMTIEVETKDGEVKTNYYQYLRDHQAQPWWGYIVGTVSNWFSDDEGIDSINGQEKINIFHLTKKQDALFGLAQKNIACAIDKKTDIISIVVKDQDPKVCALMADSTCRKLQEFIVSYRTSKARIDYEYYQKLTEEAKKDYDKALVNFSRFSDANADLVLSSMKAKEDYLESEMQLKYNVYTAMSTQMQSAGAKLQEATPAFTVIQSASMPVKAAGPKRMLIAIAMTILVAIGLTAKILLKK